MAIAASTNWDVRVDGSDDNGGGFDIASAGTNYVKQTAAQLTVTDAGATGTTNLSSATGGFTSAMVGNIVNVVGQGRRQITAFVNANNVTCDAAWGTFSGATAKVGGALLSPALALGSKVVGNTIHIKKGVSSFIISSTSSNVAGGRLTISGANTNVIGYENDWLDFGAPPTIEVASTGVTSIDMVTFGDSSISKSIANVILDGQNKTGIRAVLGNAHAAVYGVEAKNCPNGAFNTVGLLVSFISRDCGSSSVSPINNCRIHAFGRCIGQHRWYFMNYGGAAIYCTAERPAGGSISAHAFAHDGDALLLHCTAWNFNSFAGFQMGARSSCCINCHAENAGSTSIGYTSAASQTAPAFQRLLNVATYNSTTNTSFSTNYLALLTNLITLSAAGLVDPANGDFRPNSDAGGGALLRSAGFQTMPGGGGPGYPDVGTMQALASGGYPRSRLTGGGA